MASSPVPVCCGDAAPRTRLSVAKQLHARCPSRVPTASEHVLDTQHEQHVVLLRTSLVSTDICKSFRRLSTYPQKSTNCHLGNLQFTCCPPLLWHHHPKPRPCAAAARCWPYCAARCRTCNSSLILSHQPSFWDSLQLHNSPHKHTHVFCSYHGIHCCDSTRVLSTNSSPRCAPLVAHRQLSGQVGVG